MSTETTPPTPPSTAASERPTGEPRAETATITPLDQLRMQALETWVIEALRTCYDPEIPVNIYDLGLIYKVDVDPQGRVFIEMTLTSPMCPVAGSLPPAVQARVKAIEGVTEAVVDVVWEPPWTPDKMSEAAKLQLNLF